MTGLSCTCFCERPQEVGYSLTSCPGWVSVEEEEEERRGRGEGVSLIYPYEEPAFPPCFHDNRSPTVFSRGTASACESSSQWRFRPARSLFHPSSSSPTDSSQVLFDKSSSSSSSSSSSTSLAAVLFKIVTSNIVCITIFVPCLNYYNF